MFNRYAVMSVMFVLTADRFIMSLNPLLYKIRARRSRIKTALIISYIVSSAIGLVVGMSMAQKMVFLLVLGIFGCIYLLFVVVTYAIILRRIKRSKETFGKRNPAEIDNHHQLTSMKDHLVPSLIIFTYVCFGLTPIGLAVYQKIFDKEEIGSVLYTTLDIGHDLGLIADALTYIFLTKHYRKSLWMYAQRLFNIFG